VEEAWELAALDMASSKSIDWSARHTRLRYQAVISSLAVLAVSVLGLSELKLPFLFEVANQPDYTVAWISLFLFAVFSIVSFYSQSKLEKLTSNSSVDEAIKSLKVTFDLKPIYKEAKKHAPFEMARAFVDSIIQSYNDDFKMDAKKLTALSLQFRSVEVVLEDYLGDLERILFVFDSEAQALLEELAFLSGKSVLPWHFAISTASLMKLEVEVLKQSVASVLSLAQHSIGDVTTIRASKYDTKLIKSSLDLHGSDAIIDNGMDRIVDFGEVIKADIGENLKAFDRNAVVLSYLVPLATALVIIVVALGFSLRNALKFWEVL